MKSVCVLGNGQLGRMLRQAGEPLGIHVYPVGLDVEPSLIPYKDSVITAEIERWPDTPFTTILANHNGFINRDVFPIIADRLTQKQLFDRLSLPTAAWDELTSADDWPELASKLGERLIVKRRVGGYDGRGQWRVCTNTYHEVPTDAYQASIVEQAINFSGEVSLIGARNCHGKKVFYPLTHNLHQEGILTMSVAFAHVEDSLQRQAESMLTNIMDELNYIGVMAMECFVVGDTLLINELAPRVHNSGHWTQNGASISQFELHLRAILDLPLPTPVVSATSVMVNLIGIDCAMDWLSLPLVHLHWYEKEVKAGRKVGHLNLTHQNNQQLVSELDALRPMLTDNYLIANKWAQTMLKEDSL